MTKPNSYRTGPDMRGHFGAYGGRFVAETLMPPVLALEKAYEDAKARMREAFQALSADALKSNNESFLQLAETRLREYFRPEVEVLERLIGRDLSAWKHPRERPAAVSRDSQGTRGARA